MTSWSIFAAHRTAERSQPLFHEANFIGRAPGDPVAPSFGGEAIHYGLRTLIQSHIS